ncbi:DUF4097 family beta strand repeat-containing protein [Salinibacillus xinjiangensis]|uniref:DUF4097 family beta strand repeat protein n=1 Tax=Salinibacillus xinjiangensis TaxID=1229268 RepID=A0A6G1X5Y2_9BACI|nr:DUF4097 family beta strand repeat-containing protein [Salinibacillus xinjiangensis]MRG86315.1 DUF4097 family beta strand repeat protein [Salinibacillus xinjiangensis]
MKKILVGALIVVCIGLIGTVVLATGFSIGPKAEIDETKTFQANGVERVVIQSEIGNIQVKESTNNKIGVHVYAEMAKRHLDRYQYEIKQDGEVLYVTTEEDEKRLISIPFIHFDGNGERYIEVSLPKEMINQLDVESNIGEIKLGEIAVNELNVTSDVGEILIEAFSGQKANLHSNVGKTTLKSAVGEVNVQTDTGEIHVTMDEVTDDVTLQSKVGEINVQVKNIPDEVGLEVNSNVGEVDVQGPFIMNAETDGPVIKAITDVGEINVTQ